MAPLKAIRDDAGKRQIDQVLELAEKCLDVVKARTALPLDLQQALERAINRTFSTTPSSTSLVPGPSKADALACELWNAATNFLRHHEDHQSTRPLTDNEARTILLLRVLSFLLIDTARQATPKLALDGEQRIRTFKIALKACKFCLDNNELVYALKILEKCSDYVEAIESPSPLIQMSAPSQMTEQKALSRSLAAEYYLHRLVYACKSDSFDLANHLFAQIPPTQLQESPRLAEKAADLFYEAGKALSKRQLYEQAVVWFERAVSALDAGETDHQSENAAELRLTVTSSLVKCLLRSDDQIALQRSQHLVQQLSTTHGLANRITVQLLRLNVLLAQSPPAIDELRSALSMLIRSAVVTELTFKKIMQAIHQVQKVDREAARQGLADLITTRLVDDFPEEQDEAAACLSRIEQATITYTLSVSNEPVESLPGSVAGLNKLFDATHQHNGLVFTAKATHAAQTLIWKAAASSETDHAAAWSALLQHPLFENAGQINKAKIGRKMMAVALAKGDLNRAREVFYQMSSSSQNESMTRYLAFKLALRCDDYEMARESLQEIAKSSKKDQTFLYACVLEAQQSKMRAIAVAALQAILDRQSPELHLPSLLRCIAKLLIAEIGTADRGANEVMEEVVQVFENAAASTQVLSKAAGDGWESEVQWWSKNAYNLSLEHCAGMDPEHLARLLTACTHLIEASLLQGEVTDVEGLRRRKALCHFLCASAHIVLARSEEDRSDYSLQNYLLAHQQIGEFQALQPTLDEREDQDLHKKAFELLKFDLECILHLQHWDSLDACLQKCLECRDVDRWETLADIVLIIRQQRAAAGESEQSPARINRLLDRIINETWQQNKDINKASRWLRLSFSMDLKEGNGDFALELLKQSAGMAMKGYRKEDATYPETELQWLAITAFNRAVDLLSNGNVTLAREWIRGALELARYAGDDGALHANLTDRHEMAMRRLKDAGL